MSRSLMRPECSLLKKECPKLKLSKLFGDSRLLYLVQNRPAAENTLSESVELVYMKVHLFVLHEENLLPATKEI